MRIKKSGRVACDQALCLSREKRGTREMEEGLFTALVMPPVKVGICSIRNVLKRCK